MTTNQGPWESIVVDVLLELKKKQYRDFSVVIEDLRRLADNPDGGDEDATASLAKVLLLHAQRHRNPAAILESSSEPTDSVVDPITEQPPVLAPQTSTHASWIGTVLQQAWEPLRLIWETGDVATWPNVNRKDEIPDACPVFRTEGAVGAFHSQASLILGFYNRSCTKNLVIDFGLRKCMVRPKELVPAMQEYPLWLSRLSKDHTPSIVYATSSDFDIVCGRLPPRVVEETLQFYVSVGGKRFLYKEGELLHDSSFSKNKANDTEIELPMRLERRLVL